MSLIIDKKLTIPNSTDLIESAGSDISEKPVILTDNARTVLQARYLKKDDTGQVIEEPGDMFLRVAKVIADAEDLVKSGVRVETVQTLFYNMMATGEFLPNSPTLMNAGRELGQLSACFVLPIEDSMTSIFQSLRDAAMIHKSGGGTGFSFSRLRPKNDMVRTTRGISSGPVSFMSVYDAATETIKQGGTRRGANMGILRVDHPDIREFITCKREPGRFTNFNISVAVTDAFMEAVKADTTYNLINPHNGEITGTERAQDIFTLIVESAHTSGDPGIIFLDRMNEFNTIPHIGDIESTNPCGEQPLLPYESCNLGSINLSLMVTEQKGKSVIDWEHLGQLIHLAVRFLDNVIEVTKFPLEKIAEMTRKTRKIGLGVMGFADMLIKLDIPYDSDEAEQIAEQVMSFVNAESKAESHHLAEVRGPFPEFVGSLYDRREEPQLRNATTTTVAPTGTLSVIASCSSGIEPIYAIAYTRTVLEGRELPEFHPIFISRAEKAGILTEQLKTTILENQSIAHIPKIPAAFKRVFRTSSDVSVEWHIRIQSAFQRHTDNAVSKTINFPASATVHDVASAYLLAFEKGLKGITIYRDRSRDQQVLSVKQKEKVQPTGSRDRIKPRPRPQVTAGDTEKLVTGCGNLYVTVNRDEEGLCEVFCQMGRSGGCTASQSEAISRLVSLALRSGVRIDEIVSQLKGIRCPSPMWQNGKLILSCADAIATALTRHLSPEKAGGNTSDVPVINNEIDPSEFDSFQTAGRRLRGEMVGVCPDCGGVLEHIEGCDVCRACGFSRCG